MTDHNVITITEHETSYQIFLPDRKVDYIQKKIAETSAPYEADMLRDMADRLSPRDFVLDIGANIGNHTLYLAAVCDCYVMAFEPNPHLAEAIDRSATLNNLDEKITIKSKGVGARAGHAAFALSQPENLGAQNLVVDQGDIQVIALDKQGLKRPVSMIKIDVEGMELDVLHGAKKLIKRDRPILYVESSTASEFEALLKFLEKRKYLLWCSFNATPTYLFLPAEVVTTKQHLQHLLDLNKQTFFQSYRNHANTADLHSSLNNANMKYRTVSGQLIEHRATETLRSAELAEALARTQALAQELDAVSTEHTAISSQLAATQTTLSETKAAETLRSAELAEAMARGQALAQELDAASTGHTEISSQLAATQTTLSEMKAAETLRSAELAEALARTQALAQELDAASTEHTEISSQLAATQTTLSETQAAETLRSAELAEAYWALKASRAQLLDARANVEIVKTQNVAGYDVTARADISRYPTGIVKGQFDADTLRISPEIVTAWTHALPLEAEKVAESWSSLARQVHGSYPQQSLSLQYIVHKLAPSDRNTRRLAIAFLNAGAFQEALDLLKDYSGTLNLPSRTARLLQLAQSGQHDTELQVHAAQVNRNQLRVAGIMDEFTAAGYAPECDLQQLPVVGWQETLEDFQPQLLLIESAWRGLNDAWGSKVGQLSDELQHILRWCRDRGIPTTFWNKEDPVHFETFLTTAQQFDLVFTTDIDCVPRYKQGLGHNRVHFLPFACQPEVHNPIEIGPRKNAFCFAGAYYVRYPDRTRDLDDFLTQLTTYRPFEIFDRNLGKDHPDYLFPKSYQQYIVGTLAPHEIDRAYKGYDFGINLNSVKNSQSMFARRVYELLASNTRVISNYSPGLRAMFGDLVISTDHGAEALRRVRTQDEEGTADKIRLAGLRKVMLEHTYSHRVARIAHLAGLDIQDASALPPVKVLAFAATRAEAERLILQVRRQTLPDFSMVLVAEATDLDGLEKPDWLHCLTPAEAAATRLVDLAESGTWLAGFVPTDYYGAQYLTDLILATRYSQAGILGKAGYYCLNSHGIERVSGPSYVQVDRISARRALIRADKTPDTMLTDWLHDLPDMILVDANILSLDRFSYCESGSTDPLNEVIVSTAVDDMSGLSSGISETDLSAFAYAMPPALAADIVAPLVTGAVLASDMPEPGSGKVSWTADNKGVLTLTSTLGSEEHLYIYEKKGRPLKDLVTQDGVYKLHPLVGPGLNILFVAVWHDEKMQKLGHQIFGASRNVVLNPPDGTVFVRFGIRPRGPGSCDLNGLIMDDHHPAPRPVISSSRVLLLTNHYPSWNDLYRNGFVHSRVRAYRDQGITPDIYRLRPEQDLSWHEFQNIDCMTGSAEQLDFLLASGQYDHVLVHFLDPDMWQVLARHIDRIKVTVWVHGAEVQPWWRRTFNYTTDAELTKAKAESDIRMAFWRSIFAPLPKNLRFVFVSQYFADEVFEDLATTCPPDQFEVIHNPIDDTLFVWNEKPASQRGKILSIRPFASAKYANDLSVKAILALQNRDFFKDLEFLIIGDGPLFDEITAPLEGIPNVTCERGFLSQTEIAALHQDYGAFLNPTRMDAQGVSRDEAMSSGLVPISTRITAIPEFMDETCGYLAEPEDAEGLARAIADLWNNPDTFERKSRAAAKRVRAQSGKDKIIAAEIALFAENTGRHGI